MFFLCFFLEPNVKNLWMMGSIVPVTIILVVYLAFVLKIGPDLMMSRRPLNIDRYVMVYNAVQILYSSYLVKEVSKNIFSKMFVFL